MKLRINNNNNNENDEVSTVQDEYVNEITENPVTVSIITGKSKKSGREYEAVQLTVGKWKGLVFPRSTFEMDYIKTILQ